MATEAILEAAAPIAGTLGAPLNPPTPEGAVKATTTQDITKSLFNLLEGREAAIPATGQEQPPVAEEIADLPGEGEEATAGEAEAGQWPESAQKRVDKLTAQRAEARERVDALQAEKDDLERKLGEAEQTLNKEPGPVAPIADSPLSFITTPKALSEYVSAVKGYLRNIEDHFEDALDDAGRARLQKFASENGAWDAENEQFDAGKLKQLRRFAQDALQDYIPQRHEYLKQEAQASQAAEQTFPWLKDRKSAEYGVYQQVLEAMPEIRKVPHWKAVAAVYVRGLQAVAAEKKPAVNGKTTNGATRAAAPKLPGAPTAIPQRPAVDGNGIETLRQTALQSKNPKDWEKLLAAQLVAA